MVAIGAATSFFWSQSVVYAAPKAPAKKDATDDAASDAIKPAGDAPEVSAQPADEPTPAEQSVDIRPPSRGNASQSNNGGVLSPLDTRVTVRVRGAPLATFLDTISAQARVNFIITEGLEQKRVTAFLQNVTVREALQVLLEIKGLTYQQVGKSSTYIVNARSHQAESLITRIYNLNYIPLIPLTSDDTGEKESSPSGGGSSAGGGATMPGTGGGKPCLTRNQKIPVSQVICSVLTKNGDIEIEPRTNSLIVTDIPEVFPQVDQILAELDRRSPQVLIEAQIVEIDSDRALNLGFEWGGTNGELGTFTGGERDTTFPLNLPSNLKKTRFFDPLNPTGGVISTLLNTQATSSSGSGSTSITTSNTGYLKTSVLDLTQLQVTLRALVSRSEARFLGKPKILTLNNKTALMEISSNEAVSLVTSITGAQGTSQASITPERVETGVILRVTPQINREGYITMLIQPKFIDVQAAAISTSANPVFNPITRSASTMVRVKNGQTIVMGGLLRQTTNKVVRKVPLLGYIPIIGWLFTSESSDKNNSDLVVFITPTIVAD